MRIVFWLISLILGVALAVLSLEWSWFLWGYLPFALIFGLGVYDIVQRRHSLWRNYPVIGHGRMLMEVLRPPIQQYFVEDDTSGTPVNRMYRSVVYQRAKKALDTVPFGTKLDVYRIGYEWMDHSLGAISVQQTGSDPRVKVGSSQCTQPYESSILNISAMSFGALSRTAILALNRGAAAGGFAHNTGEGGLSPHHLEAGGDLIWQIGTGYFGCRDASGKFDADRFAEKATGDTVKMIEIKLSQGAKPGHGGILPAVKNTKEIAAIRHVEPGTRVDSPPTHSAFTTPLGLLEFVARLRELSGGKPVGFKLAVGRKSEFVSIAKAIVKSGIVPDFITVDGGEGGTGAAPLEYSNSVGMPLRDGLAFVDDVLTGFGLRKEIRIIASGKMFTGFHLVKNLALGADICASARGMMLALGCIQALECNNNTCPVGVATQNPRRYKGLDPIDKGTRIHHFHDETVYAAMELIAASGLCHTQELNRTHIHRRINATTVACYDEIFPYVGEGSLLAGEGPPWLRHALGEASAESFRTETCMVHTDCGLKTRS